MICAWWLIPICIIVFCFGYTVGLIGGDWIMNRKGKHK